MPGRKTLIEEEIALSAGDLVVLYTDGITEAMNRSRNEYGESKLVDTIKEYQELPSQKIIELAPAVKTKEPNLQKPYLWRNK